tara:strand:+ start:1214 stop:1996 length:783 start_codon:yes stop_codon:yes gene_type:complete
MKKKVVAVILCGGMGSRLGQLTNRTPKPLLQVMKKPIIWYVVSSLLKYRVNEIIFPLGYKGEKIERYIKKNFKKKIKKFQFVKTGIKTEILDRIKKISRNLNHYDEIIIINSDTIFDFNIRSFLNFHIRNNNFISLSGVKMQTTWGTIVKDKYNVLKKFSVNSKITSYKIKNYEKYEAFRNTGLSIINVKCLSFIKSLKNNDFEISLYNKFIKFKNIGVKIFNGFWYPIETNKDLNLIRNEKKLVKQIINLKQKLKNNKL